MAFVCGLRRKCCENNKTSSQHGVKYGFSITSTQQQSKADYNVSITIAPLSIHIIMKLKVKSCFHAVVYF